MRHSVRILDAMQHNDLGVYFDQMQPIGYCRMMVSLFRSRLLAPFCSSPVDSMQVLSFSSLLTFFSECSILYNI